MGIFETTNKHTSRGKTSILIHLIMGKTRQQYLVNEVFKADIRVRCLSISQRSMNTCAQGLLLFDNARKTGRPAQHKTSRDQREKQSVK